MTNRFLILVTVLALTVLACGGTITLPQAPTPGPTIVQDISISAPLGTPRLTISFGAGELKLKGGSTQLVDGTASYNYDALKPEIITNGSAVEIKQHDVLTLVEPRQAKSIWDLRLGSQPMELAINAGAYQGEFHLGGVALNSLTVKDGAAQVYLSFDQRNPAAMTVFRYETGASQVHMQGLANANFSTMIFGSGAGDYTLDFSGDLQRDATVTISTGFSNLTLVIPAGIPATVSAETGFADIKAGSTWSRDGNRYVQSGSGPVLTFIIKGGAGSLTLTK